MERKPAIVLTSLLLLSVMLMVPYVPLSSANGPVPPGPPYDIVVWLESNRGPLLFTAPRVILVGFLTFNDQKIAGTDFYLSCPGNWCSVDTAVFKYLPVLPNDIVIVYKGVDWDLDGRMDLEIGPFEEYFDLTLPCHHWEYTEYSPLPIEPPPSVTIQVFWGQQDSYYGAGGQEKSYASMGGMEPALVESVSTPLQPDYDIIFSCPDVVTGVVKLVVWNETIETGPRYVYEPGVGWTRVITKYYKNGYGWLFTHSGSAPILGNVDCYTTCDKTGSYWAPPSPMAGTLAAPPGLPPDTGPDCIPGTMDDGWGDTLPVIDPKGSSILYMFHTIDTDMASELPPPQQTFSDFFVYNWTVIRTTGTAKCTVTEQTSELNGLWLQKTGFPWEFVSECMPWNWEEKHPYANAKVMYATGWAQLNIPCTMGQAIVFLDILVANDGRMFREDCVIADISFVSTPQWVYVDDLRRVSKAYDTKPESMGPDGLPNTQDDKKQPDALWDAGADCGEGPANEWIYIEDLRRVSKDYDKTLTSSGPG